MVNKFQISVSDPAKPSLVSTCPILVHMHSVCIFPECTSQSNWLMTMNSLMSFQLEEQSGEGKTAPRR